MKPIIRVEGLSKQYRIGAKQASYATLRESLTDIVSAPFRRFKSLTNGNGANPRTDTIWALKDVSFEVQPGEVVGIIGRNGAGKSTLLKILSRIAEPTTGKIDLYGRVGSLLEVGTGFHPELTGRENIYLNGAILGMKHSEIARKFDEIVAFSEIEMFIDTPVKHYSSGMYMRLAFAVAAHLETEILVVDEVLAVGDSRFQRKSLGKMEEVARQGRTVLFVSHNMSAVSHLCTSGIVLDKGAIVSAGSTQTIIDHFDRLIRDSDDERGFLPKHVFYEAQAALQNNDFVITSIEALDTNGMPKPVIKTWDDLVLRIKYFCKRPLQTGSVALTISTYNGLRLLTLSTQPDSTLELHFIEGEQITECFISKIPLAAGEYYLGAGLAIPGVEWLYQKQELTRLTILPFDTYKSGLAPANPRSLFAVEHEWRVVG